MAGAVSCGVTFLVFRPVPHALAAQPPALNLNEKPVKPFTARVRTAYYSPSGQLARSVIREYMRFSDRSVVSRVTEEFPKPTDYMWEIFSVPLEQSILVDPLTRSVSTRRYSKPELLRYLRSMSEETCPSDVSDLPPGGVFFGYRAVRATTRDTDGFVQERWMIPELECFSVKETQWFKSAHNEVEAISLTEGEPVWDRASVPADYVERSPATIDELRKARGSRVFTDVQESALQADYDQRKIR